MLFVPVKTPGFIKKLLPNFIWEYTTTQKVLYLTFDDGPTPEITHWTLKLLQQFQAKATFFCIGKNIELFPDIFRDIILQGHGIGNHSHTHIKGWQINTAKYLSDINQAQRTIKNYTVPPKNTNAKRLFRPPYGQITPKQGKVLIQEGYAVVTWSILSFDWDKNTTPESCYQNIIKHTKAGDIVVFHDSVKASKNLMYALPRVLAYFSARGYQFHALPESFN
ncbi:polysaccharide deacetylase family protein [Bizionia sediminis]|uniref:Polysaccharide deacetylase family protein n=1 Tax=Bizionia sediminis TaxID=1737064 RepID=A0ABW5KUZ4_9FLAO